MERLVMIIVRQFFDFVFNFGFEHKHTKVSQKGILQMQKNNIVNFGG
jgi:hypothetical protein